jgi:hypothetical protein
MKSIILLALIIVQTSVAFTQSFTWIDTQPVNYSLNPNYTNFAIELDEPGNRVYSVYLESGNETFSLQVFGDLKMESRDLNGNLIWTRAIGNRVNVPMIETDGAGDIYIAGSFMDTLEFSPGNILVNTGTGFNLNYFIAKFDAAGNFLWSRNLSTSINNIFSIEDIESDHNGDVWYAICTITNKRFSYITQIDASGNDLQSRTIEGAVTVGAISFDPFGGLYVSGDAGMGTFILETDTFAAPFAYSIYLARYGSDGQPKWTEFGNTLTVIKPRVIADAQGNAYLTGHRYDALFFGNVQLGPPSWLSHYFLFKTDSLADFKWASPPAPSPNLPLGEFNLGQTWYTGVDDNGNVYMMGSQRGTIDYGNGIILNTSSPANRMISVMKVNSNGQTDWVKLAGNDLFNVSQSLTASSNGDCYFTSYVKDSAFFDSFFIQSGSAMNYVVGKISSNVTGMQDHNSFADLSLIGNPSAGIIQLPEQLLGSELRIYSMTGSLVYADSELASTRLDLSDVIEGVYVIQCINGKALFSEKWVNTGR